MEGDAGNEDDCVRSLAFGSMLLFDCVICAWKDTGLRWTQGALEHDVIVPYCAQARVLQASSLYWASAVFGQLDLALALQGCAVVSEPWQVTDSEMPWPRFA